MPKIPDGEFWFVASGGPSSGYVWKMLDDLKPREGFPQHKWNGTYVFFGEVRNGLKVLEWMPYGEDKSR